MKMLTLGAALALVAQSHLSIGRGDPFDGRLLCRGERVTQVVQAGEFWDEGTDGRVMTVSLPGPVTIVEPWPYSRPPSPVDAHEVVAEVGPDLGARAEHDDHVATTIFVSCETVPPNPGFPEAGGSN